ncbi:MAG: histidine phosphatase family protein [Bacilli bacterium]|nr:histidine phosphatase family protein [Bacilli bacterium]
MKIYMIRHGVPNYSYIDEHAFIGHGNDLAPLDNNYIENVRKTARDNRLKNAELIVSSPYTRALQTAAIISKETNLEIMVEPDLREWEPDLTYQYRGINIKKIFDDYYECNGIRPSDRKVNWESKEELRKRINNVIDKYKKTNKCIIFVFHQTAIQSIIGNIKVKPAEIVEYEVN